MRNYIDRTYFTMKDMGINEGTLATLCENPGSTITMNFIGYFLARYANNWAIYEDKEVGVWEENPESAEPSAEKINAWKQKFKNHYAMTYDRYSVIFNGYQAQKDNLLDKLVRSSQVKYNDTPQEDGVGASDGYNTSITTNTTQVDPEEMITRLNNIENKYSDVYYNWLKEFEFLFGEEI